MLDFLIMVQGKLLYVLSWMHFYKPANMKAQRYCISVSSCMYFIHIFLFQNIFLSLNTNSSIAVLDTDYRRDMLCQLQEKPSTNPPELSSGKLRPATQNFCLRQAEVSMKFCCTSLLLEMAVFLDICTTAGQSKYATVSFKT